MSRTGGIALRGTLFLLRVIQFCCAAIVFALYSYFLATLHNHNMPIAGSVVAVEVISAAAVVYTILALLMQCCAPGRSCPSFLTMALDLAFFAAFMCPIAVNRRGLGSCDGEVDTPFGRGNADTNVVDNGSGGFTALPSLRQACRMETASGSVSIIAMILFFVSPLLTFNLVRHRRREMRIGPSPANDHIEGHGRRRFNFNFFGLGRKSAAGADAAQNPNVLPQHPTPDELRHSSSTERTQVGNGGGYGGLGDGTAKYESPYGRGGNNIPLANFPNARSGYRS